MVVTLGRRGDEGLALLRSNERLGQYVLNVEHLRDQQAGGPYGTDAGTQERVRRTPGFRDVFNTMLGRILEEPLVIIACSKGHHRSVAIAEMVAERIRGLGALAFTVDVVHVKLGEVARDQRTRLQRWS